MLIIDNPGPGPGPAASESESVRSSACCSQCSAPQAPWQAANGIMMNLAESTRAIMITTMRFQTAPNSMMIQVRMNDVASAIEPEY